MGGTGHVFDQSTLYAHGKSSNRKSVLTSAGTVLKLRVGAKGERRLKIFKGQVLRFQTHKYKGV